MSRYFKSSNISKNERKSNILLVEVNGDAYVDPHNKKGDTGQDHGLWRTKVTFPIEKRVNGSPVPLRPLSRDFFQHLCTLAIDRTDWLSIEQIAYR